MEQHPASTVKPMDLLRMADGLIIHQALYAAAKLGVADLMQDGPRTAADLACQLQVHDAALYRILRALAPLLTPLQTHHFLVSSALASLDQFAPSSFSRDASSTIYPSEKSSTAYKQASQPEKRCAG